MSNLERLMRTATHHRSDDRDALMQRIEAKRDERHGYGKRALPERRKYTPPTCEVKRTPR